MCHTPGPWYMAMEPDGDMEQDFPGHYVGGFNGGEVYNGGGIFAYDKDMPQAALDAGEDPVIQITDRVYDEDDARLIAAAPDLLAVLKKVEKESGALRGYIGMNGQLIKEVRAVIAKAEVSREQTN